MKRGVGILVLGVSILLLPGAAPALGVGAVPAAVTNKTCYYSAGAPAYLTQNSPYLNRAFKGGGGSSPLWMYGNYWEATATDGDPPELTVNVYDKNGLWNSVSSGSGSSAHVQTAYNYSRDWKVHNNGSYVYGLYYTVVMGGNTNVGNGTPCKAGGGGS